MLISQVLPVMSIYHLPHCQYAYSGHILSLPQYVNSFVKNLPRFPSDLDVIIVRKEGEADNLAVKLLSVKALKFYIHNDVVFKVVRLS